MDYNKTRSLRKFRRRLRQLKLPGQVSKFLLFILGVVCVIGLGIIAVQVVGRKMVVESNAMEPALTQNQIVNINKLTYTISSPKRFDIIVFEVGKSGGRRYIRRVIGLPNETVRIKDGVIYINDEPLEIDFNDDYLINGGLAEEGITLEMDEYFVLADNYNEADDSRLSSIGNIQKDQIIGKIK